MSDYIEPRLRRDFGGVITAFVDFLKGNHTNLFSIFITYNFVFILIFFLYNYFVSDGVGGIIALSTGDIGGYMDYSNVDDNEIYETIGLIINILAYVFMIALNAAIAGCYLRLYERFRSSNVTGKQIFKLAMSKVLGIVGILFFAFIAAIPVIIISFIGLIIPLLGLLAFLLVLFSFFTLVGLSFFAYTYHDHITIFEAMGNGWRMLFSRYWKAVGVATVCFLLIYVASFLFQVLPGAIIGIISFNSTLDQIELQENIYIKAISFIFYAINSITTVLAFLLLMFMYGYLYLNLHETKYNIYLLSRIQKLGAR